MNTLPPKRKAGRPPGTPNPNGGRKPMPEEERRQRHTVTLDPAIAAFVQWHAAHLGNGSASESVNILLGEAMGLHTYQE